MDRILDLSRVRYYEQSNPDAVAAPGAGFVAAPGAGPGAVFPPKPEGLLVGPDTGCLPDRGSKAQGVMLLAVVVVG